MDANIIRYKKYMIYVKKNLFESKTSFMKRIWYINKSYSKGLIKQSIIDANYEINMKNYKLKYSSLTN
jgi:hypothetical protein